MSAAPYDLNTGMWPDEPHYSTQDNVVTSPYFAHNGESMDTRPAWSPQQGFGSPNGLFPLQTSPLELRATDSTFVSPVSLKRQGTELLQVDDNGLVRSSSKRSKQERLERRDDKLYECTYHECTHKYKLMCELRKHFKASHRPDEAKPCGCPHCVKRFNWPKDVRRHIRQVHKEFAPDDAAQTIPAVAEPPELIADESNESDEASRIPRTSTTEQKPQKRKKKLSLSSVGGLIMALQSLSLGSKDTDGEQDGQRHVFVTQDQETWHKVQLDGVRTSASLMHKIKEVYQKHDGRQTSKLLLYQYRSKGPNKRIEEDKLLSAVHKAAATHRTLEIVLSPIFSSPTQASAPTDPRFGLS